LSAMERFSQSTLGLADRRMDFDEARTSDRLCRIPW
jgi:hypothetical protein